MSEAHLALMLDAPMQSWGFSSRFQRRTTERYPTKSGVIGLFCAAIGLDKGSDEEAQVLPELSALRMTSLIIPRRIRDRWSGDDRVLEVRRLEDFHTVLNTRRASGKPNKDAVMTHRQYLFDAKFGVILSGDGILLAKVADALQNPVWGIWFGRKCCLPASPVFRKLAESEEDAVAALTDGRPITEFTKMSEAADFGAGTDTLADLPISFGERRFAVRRVCLEMPERTLGDAPV